MPRKKKEQTDSVLCYLDDWHMPKQDNTPKRGRQAKPCKQRHYIQSYNYGWDIRLKKENGSVDTLLYSGCSFKEMHYYIKMHTGVDTKEALKLIYKSLLELENKEEKIDFNKNNLEIAKDIDRIFRTNHHLEKPMTIRQRLFKDNSNDNEDE